MAISPRCRHWRGPLRAVSLTALALALSFGALEASGQTPIGDDWIGGETTGSPQVMPAQAPMRSGSVTPLPTDGLAPIRSETGWRVQLPGSRPLATPAVEGDTVFIGGGFGSHEFYAFDVASGEPRWAIRVSDDGPTTAVVKNGRVAFNTESCTLFIVRAQDGQQIWSRWLGDPLMSTPAIADDRVYMVYPTAATHVLAAFSLDAGDLLWSASVDTDAITAPIVADGDVYVASQAGMLYRFDGETGTQQWARRERLTSAPWVRGEQIFAAMHDETADSAGPVEGLGYVSRGDGRRGNEAGETWSRQQAPWLSREVQRRSRYGTATEASDDAVGFKPGARKGPLGMRSKLQQGFATPTGGGAPAAARVDAAAENIGQYSVSGLWGYQGSRPVLVGDLAIATLGDTVRAVDVRTGEERWSHRLGNDVAAVGGHLGTPPAVAGGRVWVATTDGEVVALDPATGAVLWQASAGAPVRAQPIVVGGRVFVGTETGQIVMIDSGHRASGDWPMWGGSAAHQL